MKRARPQGLGATSNKKDKAELCEHSVSKAENCAEEPVDSSSKSSIYELPENATALDQLRALFESATMIFGIRHILNDFLSIFILDDVSKSKPIFNGVVHECLRLESILENDNAPSEQEGDDADIDSFVQVKKDAENIFGSEFYYIFGESLRSLAEYEMSGDLETSSYDQVAGLLSASIDRFQVANEKSDSSKKFENEILNGTIYAMTCLLALIDDNESLNNDLCALISGESRELVQSAIFDVTEFFISYLELCHDQEFKYDGPVILSKIFIKNIPYLEKINADYDPIKFDLATIDVQLRLNSILESEINDEKASELCSKLDSILSELKETPQSVQILSEALHLKASIKEIMGFDEEANAIYAEAEALI